MEARNVPDRPPRTIVDTFGASALHFAARSGNLAMLHWLLETGTDPALRARNGATAAHDAAATGQLQCLQCVLLYDEKLTQVPLYDNDVYPLHLASMFGRGDVISWLVENGFDPAGLPSGNGSTPLHYAAARGHVGLLRYLINLMTPEQLNSATFDDGVTAMFRAAEENQPDCVKILHSCGASATAASHEGLQPVHAAARSNALDVLRLLLSFNPESRAAKTQDGYSPVHIAAGYGHSRCLMFLLEEQDFFHESWTDLHGNTPVHAAAKYGQMESLNLFADRGVPLGQLNADGKSPADLARECHHTEAAIFLTLKT
eukprot:m.177286 g.177286  ORF g.177286 m.177286 type:complete len:316 (-) comp17961_c2_seq2:158-1105(-)